MRHFQGIGQIFASRMLFYERARANSLLTGDLMGLFKHAHLALFIATLVFTIAIPARAQDEIRPGSVISITVLGSPELSQTLNVSEDGTTTYPVLGDFKVEGMTTTQLTDLLTNVISRIVDRPQVMVSLHDYRLVNISVKGAVQAPGEVVAKAPVDIQDAIAQAGGPVADADLRRVAIVRETMDEESGLKGRQVQRVDMASYSVIREGYDPILLNMGDIVIVPTLGPDSYVRVLGAVFQPGRYVPVKDATVVDVIYQAGGPKDRADLSDVRLIRRVEGESVSETKLDLEDVFTEQAELPGVHPGDVVIVGRLEDYQTLTFWVRVLRDITLLFSSIVIISRL
jgi:protein involved in polysaccharide export with SLBB domain